MSCKRDDHKDLFFQWDNTVPQFDTLTKSLDKAWALDAPYVVIDSLTNEMSDFVRRNDMRKQESYQSIKGRTLYFLGRRASIVDSWDSTQMLLDSAFRIYADSARFPYAFARIAYLSDVMAPSLTVDTYFDLVERSRFFRDHGDMVMHSVCLAALGNELMSLGDSLGALSYFEKAIPLMDDCGMERWKLKFQLSLAQALHGSSPHKSDSIMKKLLHNKYLQSDSIFYSVVLHSAYLFSGDIHYIERAYPLVKSRKGFEINQSVFEAFLAFSTANPDSMGMFVRSALNHIHDSGFPRVNSLVTSAAAAYYERTGDLDSALWYMKKKTASLEALNELVSNEKVHSNELRLGIARQEALKKENELRNRLMRWIIVLAAAIIVMYGVAILQRRIKKLESMRTNAELDLTRHKLQLASTAVVLEEKNKVMESMIDTINSLRAENKISAAEAHNVSSALKVHAAAHEELEAFQAIYKKIHPMFRDRLKHDFPEMSENNVKIASFICIGMSARQIARVMGIEYKSVITARHRLRHKMGLTKGMSLEDALRPYAELPQSSLD